MPFQKRGASTHLLRAALVKSEPDYGSYPKCTMAHAHSRWHLFSSLLRYTNGTLVLVSERASRCWNPALTLASPWLPMARPPSPSAQITRSRKSPTRKSWGSFPFIVSARKHLYKRVRPSVCLAARSSIRPSGPPLVRNVFSLSAERDVSEDILPWTHPCCLFSSLIFHVDVNRFIDEYPPLCDSWLSLLLSIVARL